MGSANDPNGYDLNKSNDVMKKSNNSAPLIRMNSGE